MANINISDLRPAGADLFSDSESYINDLTEPQMMEALGGFSWFGSYSYGGNLNNIINLGNIGNIGNIANAGGFLFL